MSAQGFGRECNITVILGFSGGGAGTNHPALRMDKTSGPAGPPSLLKKVGLASILTLFNKEGGARRRRVFCRCFAIYNAKED